MNITDQDIQEIRANFAALTEEEKERVREFARTEDGILIAKVLGLRPSLFRNLVKSSKRPAQREIQGLGAPV